MTFLIARLAQLQIFQGIKYKALAHNNTTRTALIRAPRGILYDRFGRILATSKQSLSVVISPASIRENRDNENLIRTLANFIDLDYADIKKLFQETDPLTPLPIVLDNDVDIKTAIKIYENKRSLPGISIEQQSIRYYPYGSIAAHLLGYIGQISKTELENGRSRGLGLGDIVGKDGIEKIYDEQLQGVKGESRVAVNRYGKTFDQIRTTSTNIKEPIKGQDLYLTIDVDLQKAADLALEGKKGALIAVDPRTGEILTLASAPSFDPNLFTKPITGSIFAELMSQKAFLNRSLNAFTPGSIWKPLTILAALQHGVANPDELLHVSGAFYMGGFRFGDWTSAEGMMNLKTALAWSRNTYFYQIAKRMKPEWLSDLAHEFGIGELTNIEVLGERPGILPSPAWKKKNLKEDWYPGNTLHFAIGQSFLLVSPLQIARMYSGIASGGYVPQLHLVRDKNKEKRRKIPGLKKENIDILKSALEECVASGTGQASKFPDFKVAGKTGSAEVPGYAHTTHGWFASYAPAEDPKIVIVALIEGGGHGGSVAAPVVRKVYEAYFAKIKADAEKKESSTTNP